eukprot:SAG11_NODE_13863_length_635_cov_2.860075_1_plen_64_part_10
MEGSRRYLLDSCTNIQYVPPGRTVLVHVLFCTYVMIVPERTMARLAARLEAARRADYTLHAAIA